MDYESYSFVAGRTYMTRDGADRGIAISHVHLEAESGTAMNVGSPCRTYIVYRHELFAQGVRSVLAQQSGVQIVGMENDAARATNAVHTLRPEVILVEEPQESGVAWPILEWAAGSRIVTFSIQHDYATVYHPHRTAAGDPVDLIRAIHEAREGEMPREAPLEVRVEMPRHE